MELTGDVNPSMEALNRADILIVTPEVTEPTAAIVGSSFTTCLCLLSLRAITDYLSIYSFMPHSPINHDIRNGTVSVVAGRSDSTYSRYS
jgi:hypothetical protein